MNIPIITVDGPSGSGKGTLCYLLAKYLGWHLLDSGAIYRVLAFVALNKNISFDNIGELVKRAKILNVVFESNDQSGSVRIIIDGVDETRSVRTEKIAAYASKIASNSDVRGALLQRQRDFCQKPGLIADGRDMGSVVFVEAPLKIFLTASVEVRASRRVDQLIGNGFDANIAIIIEEVKARDDRDFNRSVAPLKPAFDAYVIDSSDLTINEVLEMVLERAKFKDLN
jgi:cytidylate kinase